MVISHFKCFVSVSTLHGRAGLVFSLCLFSWFFNCREELFRTLHIFSKDIPSIPKAHYHRLAAGKLRWNERSHALFKNEWNEKPDVAPHHPNHWSIVARLSNKHGLNHGPQNWLFYEESSLPKKGLKSCKTLGLSHPIIWDMDQFLEKSGQNTTPNLEWIKGVGITKLLLKSISNDRKNPILEGGMNERKNSGDAYRVTESSNFSRSNT